MEKESAAEGSIKHPRCPYCHEGVAPGQEKQACDACMAWHHSECWGEHGGCSACGSEARVGEAPAPRPAITPREHARQRPADGLVSSEIANENLKSLVEVEEARRELRDVKYHLASILAALVTAAVIGFLSLSFAARGPGLPAKLFALLGLIAGLFLLGFALRRLITVWRIAKRAGD